MRQQDGSKLGRNWCPVAFQALYKDRGAPLSLSGFGSTATMTDEQQAELKAQLARLRQEHRDLDAAIEALQETPGSDILQVQRLKKRKLYLRDRITFIEDQLTPDIIA